HNSTPFPYTTLFRSDPDLALAEEEVTDDRPDHRQTSGDPQTSEDRRERVGEHELAQPSETAGVVQGEQVVHAALGRLQPEQRVQDRKSTRLNSSHVK